VTVVFLKDTSRRKSSITANIDVSLNRHLVLQVVWSRYCWRQKPICSTRSTGHKRMSALFALCHRHTLGEDFPEAPEKNALLTSSPRTKLLLKTRLVQNPYPAVAKLATR
jgi:hypothetical protein